MGINYEEIESNSVGNKIDYIMHSLDFEEYLWAKGYSNEQIEDLYQCMTKNEPLSKIQYDVMMENFQEYMIVGGMPLIVKTFVENKTYTGIIVADMLVKEGYNLYFYRDETGRLEMDFFVRDTNYLIPVEVKASDNSTISLNNLIDNDKYKDIKYGIKLCNKNIGFNGKFYTFPYFLTFLLKRYLNEKNI